MAIHPAAEATADGAHQVDAVSVAGQQHGMVVLDGDGRVLRPAKLWNDTESAAEAGRMVAQLGATTWATRTGSVPVAAFTVTKLAWLARLRDLLAATCSPSDPVAVLGDFNVAPEDRDVWDVSQFEGMTHVSPPERRALADLEAWGLVDVFRRLYDEDGLFSWWDYRGGSFHRHRGMRIDLALVTEVLAARTSWALIDRNARKGEKPSDHTPVFVDTGGA